MILIEEISIDNMLVRFYDGIDFDIVMNHPKDGKSGFIFCFIENWVSEVKKWERNSKIDSVMGNKYFEKFQSESIENNYVAIYQLDGVEIDVLFKMFRLIITLPPSF